MSSRFSRQFATACSTVAKCAQTSAEQDICRAVQQADNAVVFSQPSKWKQSLFGGKHGASLEIYRVGLVSDSRRGFRSSAVLGQPDAVTVRFDGELVVVELRIPGSAERRRFVLRRNVDRLSSLFAAIRAEGGFNSLDLQVRTADGARLAASTLLSVAFGTQNDSLRLVMCNGSQEEQLGEVQLLVDAGADAVAAERLQQLRAAVDSLYRQFNVSAFRSARRQAYEKELQLLRSQIEPLEQHRNLLQQKAARSGKRFAWFGMAYMGVQVGILARLTWWEYSWDIVRFFHFHFRFSTTSSSVSSADTHK